MWVCSRHVWVYVRAVVFYLGSVLRLLLGSGQQWGGFYRTVSRERVYRAVAPGTCLPSRCLGTCLPSRCPEQRWVCGNVRDTSECMYVQWCFIWCPLPGNVFTEPLPRATLGMWECSIHVWMYVCMCSGVLFGVRSEAELLPRERVCRVVSSGMCLPSRCSGKVFTEPLLRERVYRAVATGTCLASRCRGKLFGFVPKQR
jgi:hypothetical protein